MSFARRYANFTAFIVVAIVAAAAFSFAINPTRAVLAGFDCGVLVFLVLLVIKFRSDKAATMRSRAAANEPDHHTLTALAMLVVAIVLTAVWVELTGHGGAQGTGIALSATTLALCWLFANSLFALHYAHVYYLKAKSGKADTGGLEFPGTDSTPDYWDFAYYAFVLGMTFQVSDVQITSQRMRRLALLHGMLAFLFNIAVVALSVSLVASALAPSPK